MDKKTASTRTGALLSLFDYQTDFFPKALVGISQGDTYKAKADEIAKR